LQSVYEFLLKIPWTYPENANGIEGAVWRAIRLDHAEHSVQLPADEEDDEQVVGIPKALEVRPASLFHGKEHHDTEGGCHDPASRTGARGEVGCQEGYDTTAGGGRCDEGKFIEVDHVGKNVDDTANNNRPCRRLVEGDVFVEGDDVVQRCPSEERDEVTANREEDEDDVDVQNESGGSGNGCEDVPNASAGTHKFLSDNYAPKVMPNVALAPTRLSLIW
jgi:hypothetical protein